MTSTAIRGNNITDATADATIDKPKPRSVKNQNSIELINITANDQFVGFIVLLYQGL